MRARAPVKAQHLYRPAGLAPLNRLFAGRVGKVLLRQIQYGAVTGNPVGASFVNERDTYMMTVDVHDGYVRGWELIE